MIIQSTLSQGLEVRSINPQKNESTVLRSVPDNVLVFNTEDTTYDASNEIIYGMGYLGPNLTAFFNVWNLQTGQGNVIITCVMNEVFNISLGDEYPSVATVKWNPKDSTLYGITVTSYFGPCVLVTVDVKTGAYQNVTEISYPLSSKLLLDDVNQVRRRQPFQYLTKRRNWQYGS